MKSTLIQILVSTGVFCLVTACSKGGQNGGTSTDVGGGGSGIEAVWKQYSNDLERDLRLLVATPLEVETADFDLIKAKLPALMHSARVKIVGYPLLLGIETADLDNPSGAAFQNPEECSSVTVRKTEGKPRDAINFPSQNLIKVSETRLLCYIAIPDQMRKLVLHEYLGLLGYREVNEDGETDYRITNAILEAIRGIEKFEQGLEIRWVRNCEQFANIGQDMRLDGPLRESSVPLATYKLANDIDCTGVELRKSLNQFQPRFLNVNIDGNGYTVYGISIVPYAELDLTKSIALFEDGCSHCMIANLKLVDTYVEGEGILFIRNSGQIANVAVLGKLKVSFSEARTVRGVHEAGGLIRENFGVATNINTMIEVDGIDIDHASRSSLRWIGGVVGSNYGNISRSNARAAVNSSGNAGGFAAWNSGSINSVVTRLFFEGSDVTTVAGFAAYNEGRVEKILAEGKIRIYDENNRRAIAGGLIAVARSIGKASEISQAITSFPFRVGHTSADVSICGANLRAAAPLIAKYDGLQDVRVEATNRAGIVYDSYGYGELTDSCTEVP